MTRVSQTALPSSVERSAACVVSVVNVDAGFLEQCGSLCGRRSGGLGGCWRSRSQRAGDLGRKPGKERCQRRLVRGSSGWLECVVYPGHQVCRHAALARAKLGLQGSQTLDDCLWRRLGDVAILNTVHVSPGSLDFGDRKQEVLACAPMPRSRPVDPLKRSSNRSHRPAYEANESVPAPSREEARRDTSEPAIRRRHIRRSRRTPTSSKPDRHFRWSRSCLPPNCWRGLVNSRRSQVSTGTTSPRAADAVHRQFDVGDPGCSGRSAGGVLTPVDPL